MTAPSVVPALDRLISLLANNLLSGPPGRPHPRPPRIGPEAPLERLRDVGLADGRARPPRDPYRD